MGSPNSSKIELRPIMDIADPDGDVILLVGTENSKSIRASSKVLTLASPVFAAMLGPNFSEGSKLSTAQPYELHLPEDDPEAIIWLCLILHYQRQIDDGMTLSLFENLALVCNKYDCANSLSSWSKVWLLHRVEARPKDKAHYERLLYTSYVYGIHESFWASSKAFLLNGHPNSSGAAVRPDSLTLGLALLPDRLLDSMNHDREEMILDILQTIENLIRPHLVIGAVPNCKCNDATNVQPSTRSGATPSTFSHPDTSPFGGFVLSPIAKGPDVCLRSKRIIHYFQELLRIGLWPITGSMRETTISSILTKLQQYQNLPGDFNVFGGNGSSCGCILTNFKLALHEAATKVELATRGLCLTCAQNGRISTQDGNCHALYRSLCSGKGSSTSIFGTKSTLIVPSASTTPGLFTVPSVFENQSIFGSQSVSGTPGPIPKVYSMFGPSATRN